MSELTQIHSYVSAFGPFGTYRRLHVLAASVRITGLKPELPNVLVQAGFDQPIGQECDRS